LKILFCAASHHHHYHYCNTLQSLIHVSGGHNKKESKRHVISIFSFLTIEYLYLFSTQLHHYIYHPNLGFKVRGLIVAAVTAFNADGSINLDIIPTQGNYCTLNSFLTFVDFIFVSPPVKRLVESGVNGAWITGTTGESLSLTIAERKAIAEAWMKAVSTYPDFSLIVHTGAANILDSIELSKHAESIKVHSIAAVPPQFFKPGMPHRPVLPWRSSSLAYIFRKYDFSCKYHATNRCICAQYSVLLLPYPIPYQRQPQVRSTPPHSTFKSFTQSLHSRMYDFLAAAYDKIPTLVGMKYTWTDMMDFSDCTRFFSPSPPSSNF